MKKLLIAVALLTCTVSVKSATINPMSNALGDSAATAGTLVYRDSLNLSALGLLSFASTQVGTGGSQNLGINISTTIPVSSSYEVLLSSGANILLTSTPNISTTTVVGGTVGIADGTILVISSTGAATISLQDNGTLSGSQLELGAASRAITAKKTLTLIFNAALSSWLELAYGNN